ncbi:vWA domain-containing protein [Undibacterium sp. Di24W]|uniref:vWA domain-containing protein n=1 Tax=Undibacterium sp. Di24W TaxID=3413033 RepID=UPI003BF15EC9
MKNHRQHPLSQNCNRLLILGVSSLLMACSASSQLESSDDAQAKRDAKAKQNLALEAVIVEQKMPVSELNKSNGRQDVAIVARPTERVFMPAPVTMSESAPATPPPAFIPPAEMMIAPAKAANYAPAMREAPMITAHSSAQSKVQDTAKYQSYQENSWKRVAEDPVSTFSADVDTGSYANVRRFIQQGQLPNPDAVRAEELVNYFSYDYALPNKEDAHPFSVNTQLTASPWNAKRQLLRIAIKGKDIAKESLPAANLVFLVDVSGSMSPQDRLPLVRSALKLLTTQLRAQDRVSLVTYANGTQVVLTPTPGNQKDKINLAIDQLSAGGGTNGEAGIKLAYAQAHAAKISGGINRVLLATDGDLNIGVTNDKDLKSLVERERKAGISLSTLGVGDSNYNEALMKKLADNGDGSYHYLDSLQEAHKVLVNEYTSTLAPIAQDLKLQLEFNPALVKEYRLIGYELRALTREQFNDDKVDAGDIGSGHTVTALYEIVPQGSKGNVDPLRYQADKADKAIKGVNKQELAWLKLRYKQPGSTQSQLIETPIQQATMLPNIRAADQDFRFATAVAAWAQWLRGSSLIENFGPKDILALANSARGNDRYGHRAEFVRLVELSSALHPAQAAQHKAIELAPDGE